MAKITPEELHSSLLNKINEIDNINNVIDTKLSVIENQIYNSEKVSYTTEDGVVAFNSDFNGYTDNVVIQGKTLNNIIEGYSEDTKGEVDRLYLNISYEPTNGTYTIINTSSKKIIVSINNTDNTWNRDVHVPTGASVQTLSATEKMTVVHARFTEGWTLNDISILEQSVFILEGDCSNIETKSFRGIKSVSQDNGFIISYKKLSTNLVDNITIVPSHYVHSMDGTTPDHTAFSYSEEYIEIEGGYDYLLENINAQFAIYDSSKNIIPQDWNDTTSYWINGDNYQATFVYAMPSNARYIRINLPIENCKPYALYKVVSDKKDLPVTLRSLPNGVCDTIEKRGNKYVLVKRCEEIVLNGSENDILLERTGTNTLGFVIKNILTSHKNTWDSILSDKFKVQVVFQQDLEGIQSNNNNPKWIHIGIDKTDLATQDLNGFRTWLQSNPVTVVYELASSEIIELTDIGVQVFEGETTIMVSASPVANDINFDVKTSLDSKMNTVQDRLTALENSMINRLTALENSMANEMAYLESCLDSIAKIRGVL